MQDLYQGEQSFNSNILNFEDTTIAFKGKSDVELNRAYWLFKIININFLTKIGLLITNFALSIGLPIKSLIKATIFRHFCGGETIEECEKTIQQLAEGKVGTILDYSVEGEDEETIFDTTCQEILKTIQRARGDGRIPLTVFKITGLGRFDLLEKWNTNALLDPHEKAEFARIKARVNSICKLAQNEDVSVMIDAEESWIQNTINSLAIEMIRNYNHEKPIVYNTYQLYRKDKLPSLKTDLYLAKEGHFILGVKLVRGAYMDKERQRAREIGYISPIQQNKHATDDDYDEAIKVCIENLDSIALVAGTHNENSCKLLADLMHKKQLPRNHRHVYFAQLLGMSDNLSFNLANAGYNVAKYVPYGPIKKVLPYLFRRAKENTSVTGKMSRELALITKEKKRRRV